MPGSGDLNPTQTSALASALTAQARYLSRLVRRMQRLGWPNDDPLYARALRARDSVLALLDQTNQTTDRAEKPAWIRAHGD